MTHDQETRISLVEQNYNQLDKRMEKVEDMLVQLREDQHEGQKTMIKTIYTTMALFSGVIITAFGVIITLIQ